MNTGNTTARPLRAGMLAATAALLFCWTIDGFAGEKAADAASPACKQNAANREGCRTNAVVKTPVTKPADKPKPEMGPGAVVWLDSEKMIYYCAEHANFGKTKQGYLIPEEHAKARRGRAFQGKTCS